MTAEARLLFVMAFQRFCQHKRNAARLCRALAARAPNTARRALLLALAANKEQRAKAVHRVPSAARRANVSRL